MGTDLALPVTLCQDQLEPGDRIVLYTDGVTETRDSAGRFFPLLPWLREQGAVPPRRLLDLLHDRLLGHGGGCLDDDIAALVVRVGSAAPGQDGPDGAGPGATVAVPPRP